MQAQINTERLNEVLALTLKTGSHPDIEHGLCVMEAVAYVAGERWSDSPKCACPVIASFLRSWNDRLPTDERQELKQHIPLLVGSKATPGVERKRSWMAADWAARECAPLWLRRAGMNKQAEILESLSPIYDHDSWQSVRPAIRAIREETYPMRQAHRDKVYAAVKEKLTTLKPAAAAVADADADAAAAAAAVAVADAAAAADAAADAAAVWWGIRDKIYEAVKSSLRGKLRETSDASRASVHALVRRMLEAA